MSKRETQDPMNEDLVQNKKSVGENAESKANTDQERVVMYSEIEPENKLKKFIKNAVILAVVGAFVITCGYKTRDLYVESSRLNAQKQALVQELSDEKAKSLQNKVDQDYYRSDKYKEEMARNRFRLIYPGEILVQIDN